MQSRKRSKLDQSIPPTIRRDGDPQLGDLLLHLAFRS